MQRHHQSVLLFDLLPSSGHGKSLKNILDCCMGPPLTVRHVQAELLPSVQSNFSDDDDYSNFNHRLCFVIIDGQRYPESKEFLRCLLLRKSCPPVILIIEEDDSSKVIDLLNLGGTDFISPPFNEIDVLPRVSRLLRNSNSEEPLCERVTRKFGLRQIVGKSANFLSELEKIPIISGCDANVLISGETGTGKELIARALHHLSPRANKPFIPVNCGAIPETLFENELFGHERGAYTDARAPQIGLIQEADGGTLFLDEIDCLSSIAQVKFLRFVEEKEYRPLGSNKVRRADVRIISASNADLGNEVKNGNLRTDLYYRLNVIQLKLPPLRDRKEDIPLLAQHFTGKFSKEFDKPAKDLTCTAVEKLLSHDWPGNVRELENVIERAVVLAERELLHPDDIPLSVDGSVDSGRSYKEAKAKAIWQFEESFLQSALKTSSGNITHAAQSAHKNRRAFWELIRKHRIDVSSFKP